jgi:DNA-binding LytR/AlgR family response regulator
MIVLIVENEKPAAAGLSRLIKKIEPGIIIAGITETVESTINWLQTNPSPDLIFMDIQLDDGLCFELFETVDLSVPVIFTTAYDDYMLSAFKVNSVDYLLKPIEESALKKAIDKFRSIHYKEAVKNDLLKQLLNEVNKGYKNRFLIQVGEHYISVPDNEISCFHILDRAVFIRTFSNKDYPVDHSLEQIQKMVDPDKFFRINRNYIVNFNAIKDITGYSSSRLNIKLNNQPAEELIVSKDRVSDFKKWIDK